jgi:hypothetical protein
MWPVEENRPPLVQHYLLRQVLSKLPLVLERQIPAWQPQLRQQQL